MVVVSEVYVGGSRGSHGSRIVSSAANVLGMSVVRGSGMRGVGGVCEMCMYSARVA